MKTNKILIDEMRQTIADIDNVIAQNPMIRTILPDVRARLAKTLEEVKNERGRVSQKR